MSLTNGQQQSSSPQSFIHTSMVKLVYPVRVVITLDESSTSDVFRWLAVVFVCLFLIFHSKPFHLAKGKNWLQEEK